MTEKTVQATAASAETIGEDVNVVDHRSGKPADDDGGLVFPFEKKPENGDVVEIAPGILWARLPLPFSLDHINIYLFDEGDSWSVVDTGINGSLSRDAWQALEAGALGGRPISHVVATHLHPDHLGLAGWLVERHGARFSMTMGEYLLASNLWHGASADFPDHELQFLFEAGVDRSTEPAIRAAGYGHFKRGVHALPPKFDRLEDGSEITLGQRRWRVVIGRGHSPEHACLLCLDEPLFIAGDQVLPRITSNVSVYGREPRANPLAHWIASLERMKQVPGDPMVLPSHGRVYRGLHARLSSLIGGHVAKLGSLHTYISDPKSVIETFPALFRRKITGFDFYLALGEAMAHLHLLESLNLVTRRFEKDIYYFQAQGGFDPLSVVPGVMALKGVPLRSLSDHD